jgi:ubiquinol-cytochrome c reductase cytochrome b subunit
VGVATLALLGMLFIASSTDVIANFFRLPLNQVLWAMRILVIISPIVAYPITWKICKEVQALHGGGKRKTANVVTRTAQGEYVATPAPKYVDDQHQELDATPVPRFIVEGDEPESSGVRVADR